MPQVKVFNPSNGPVTVDNARCVGGNEFATVDDTPLVQKYIATGVLISKKKPDNPQPMPVVETPEEQVDPPSIVDGSDDVPPVSSEVEDTADEPETDATETQPKPASMKRRRKTPPVKE